jgi:hypothetical protein
MSRRKGQAGHLITLKYESVHLLLIHYRPVRLELYATISTVVTVLHPGRLGPKNTDKLG